MCSLTLLLVEAPRALGRVHHVLVEVFLSYALPSSTLSFSCICTNYSLFCLHQLPFPLLFQFSFTCVSVNDFCVCGFVGAGVGVGVGVGVGWDTGGPDQTEHCLRRQRPRVLCLR